MIGNMPLRIFVVEDDADIAQLIEIALSLDDAIESRFARTGADAIRQLSDDWQPDCILSDYRLPDMDALDLLNAIRQSAHLAQVPMIVLTADPRAPALRAGSSGISGIIAKPFHPISLAEKVCAMIDVTKTVNLRHSR